MTVSNTQTSITLPGNGVNTSFGFPFEIPYQDDGVTPAVLVTLTNTLVTPNISTILSTSLYSISGVGNPAGGVITYTGGGVPLPIGWTMAIERAKALTQPFSFPNMSFEPSQVEAALDNVVLEMQQLSANMESMEYEGELNYPSVATFGYVDPTGANASDVGFTAALTAGVQFFVPPGTYTFTSSKTFPANVIFAQGAVLTIPTGTTFAFNGGLTAGAWKIFANATAGLGTVTINSAFTQQGYVEWWGAVTGTTAVDCAPAMRACFAAMQTAQLLAADYYIQSTVQFNRSGCNLFGMGCGGTNIGLGISGALPMGEPGCTRIILTGPAVQASIVFQIGFTRAQLGTPVDNASIMRNSIVRDILFARDTSTYKANAATTSDPATSVWGVAVTFMSGCLIERCKSFDSPVGFRYEGCVTTTIRDCNAAIVTLPTTGTYMYYVGHLVGGYIVNYGYIGANASLYLDHCTTFDQPAGFTKTWGMRVYGLFADTFISKFEDARHDIGLEIDGANAYGSGTPCSQVSGQQDIKVSEAVCDGNAIYSIYAHNTNDGLSLLMDEPYMASSGSTAALTIDHCAGTIEITMGHMFQSNNPGVAISNVNGLSIRGLHVRDSSAPFVLTTVGYSEIEPRIFNLAVLATNGLSMVGCFRNVVKPQITQAPSFMNYGIVLDSASTYNCIDPTMVEFDQMTSPTNSSLKVRFNGADASTGAGNTAFLAAHNVLTGITN